MHSQIDPGFALGDKIRLSRFAALREKTRVRTLHGKVHAPALVMNLPDASHPAFYGVGNDLIELAEGRLSLSIQDGRVTVSKQ